MKRLLAGYVLCFLPLLPTTAQEKSVLPGINKPFENPDLEEFIQKFEGESREIAARAKEIVAACEERILKENYFVRFEKAEAKEGKLDLHPVAVPVKSNRLLSMSIDDDGFIWVGGFHKCVHRYDPRTGKVDNFNLPSQPTASACICAGAKVYILGQQYPKLTILDRKAATFREVSYPSSKPNVWYGTDPIDGRHLFLFDRGGSGVIKWDTQAESGKAILWPYKAPFPSSGRYEPRDKAIWCKVMDHRGLQYKPVGIARLDVATERFTDWFPFPNKDDDLKPFTDHAKTIFLPCTLEGMIVPFDFKEKRWCRFLVVPQFGQRFGFLGGPVPHRGRYYFSLSTYNGTEIGCDGKPFHFCNAILEFEPKTRQFEFLTLEAKDAYHQIAYMLSARGEFFATGSNIREPDGTLNRSRKGEVVFWQTLKLRRNEKERPVKAEE